MNTIQKKELSLKHTDKSIIAFLLVQNKKLGLPRDQMSYYLDIPRTTIYDSLTRLKRYNILNNRKVGKSKGKMGRRKIHWFLTRYYLNGNIIIV